MSEELNNPNQHSLAERAAAIGMAVVSIAGNNMPGVGHETQSVTTTTTSVEHVVEQVPATLPSNPADTVITLTPGVNNEYRVDFQTTDADGHASEQQVTTELDKVLGPEDWARAYDIDVEGGSSAEDEHAGGGFQEHSDANTNLALQRALIAARPVMDAFKAKGVDVTKDVVKEPGKPAEKMMQVVGVEDSWSDDELAKATGFAEQFGYASVEEMVEHHNDGGTPPAVNEFLRPLLEDHRGAVITIRLRGADGAPDKTVLVTVVRDKVTVKDVTRDVETTDIVNNQVIGHIPEQAESPIVDPIEDNSDKNPRVRTPVVVEIPGPTKTPTPVVKPPVNRPWERGRKDAAFRERKRAPQGNGAKPLRFGGGVPFNPTPSNFS